MRTIIFSCRTMTKQEFEEDVAEALSAGETASTSAVTEYEGRWQGERFKFAVGEASAGGVAVYPVPGDNLDRFLFIVWMTSYIMDKGVPFNALYLGEDVADLEIARGHSCKEKGE